MISALRGTVDDKFADRIVIDAGGVGYGIYVTNSDDGVMSTGEAVKLYIYEHIRENSHDLYGFLKRDTQALFERLINVNGVGPKMGLNILNIGSTSDLINAIASGDVKYIQAASGVGKKVAERVIIDLKDKVGEGLSEVSFEGVLGGSPGADDAVQALVALGFSQVDASNSLRGLPAEMPVDEKIKQALKGSR